MRLLPVLAALALACAAARPDPPLPRGLDDGAARAALGRFALALDASRWEEALALLSGRWRRGYTPARLALDFAGADLRAREAADRIRAALDARAPIEIAPGRARLQMGLGRAAVLVAEDGAWRVDAME